MRQRPPGLRARDGEFGEGRLDEAALVVPGLVPGVREEDPQLRYGTGRQHGGEHLGGVRLHDADVAQAAAVDLDQGVGQSRGVDLNGKEVRVRVLLGGVADGVAEPGADLHDQRRLAAELGFGVEDVVRVHGGVGDVAGDLDGPPVGMLLPRSLPAALQPGAAAHEADRAAAVGAEGGLAAGGHRARWLRRFGGFWGFTHPFQNSGVPASSRAGPGRLFLSGVRGRLSA